MTRFALHIALELATDIKSCPPDHNSNVPEPPWPFSVCKKTYNLWITSPLKLTTEHQDKYQISVCLVACSTCCQCTREIKCLNLLWPYSLLQNIKILGSANAPKVTLMFIPPKKHTHTHTHTHKIPWKRSPKSENPDLLIMVGVRKCCHGDRKYQFLFLLVLHTFIIQVHASCGTDHIGIPCTFSNLFCPQQTLFMTLTLLLHMYVVINRTILCKLYERRLNLIVNRFAYWISVTYTSKRCMPWSCPWSEVQVTELI